MDGPVIQKIHKSILYHCKNLFCNGRFILKLLRSDTQRKHVFRWIFSLKQNYLFDTPYPWLVFDAVDYIQPRLFKGMNVFEYGSGGSTLFWLYYGSNVVSIEHNPQWYDLMKKKITSNQPIDYRLIIPDSTKHNNLGFDPSNPENYVSANDLYRAYEFGNYVTQIDVYPDGHFDLIVIDGRARPSCIKHSIKKVKIGGYIILDNSDREYYLTKTNIYLKNFFKVEFYGAIPGNTFFSKTNIYMKLK